VAVVVGREVVDSVAGLACPQPADAVMAAVASAERTRRRDGDPLM